MNQFLLTLLATSMVWAQNTSTSGSPQTPSIVESLLPFIVMFGILYFVMIRPQMKKQKEHQNFVTNLKRGDEIITQTGILGRIEGLTNQFVTLEIAEGVRIKMLRAQVASSAQAVIQAAQVAQKESNKK